MPPLPDPDPPILSAVTGPQARRLHPSPVVDGLALENVSVLEAGYLGHVFGVDTPFYVIPTGFGEFVPDFDAVGGP